MLTGGRFWKLLLLVLCLLWGAIVSIQRLSVSAEISGASGATLKEIRAAAISLSGKKSLGLGIRPAPSPIELRFEVLSETEALARLPKLVRIRTFDGASPQVDNAKVSDGYLVWRSELPDCQIEIEEASFIRSVTIVRPAPNGSNKSRISLDNSLTRFKSHSGRYRLHMSVPLTARDIFFVTGDSGRRVVLEKIGVYWGTLLIVGEGISTPLHKFKLSIPPVRVARTALRVFGALVRSIFGGMWIASCFVLAGLPLVRLLGFRGAASEYVTLAYIFAMSVGLCVTVTFGLAGLSLGGSAGLFWIISCCGGMCLILRWLPRLGLAGIRRNLRSYCEHSDLLPLCAISICCATMLFTPSALSPGGFFGHNYTDTYWYLNVATDLWSIPPRVFSADLWRMQRLGDIASVVLVRAISGSSTMCAYQDLAVAVTLSLPWVIYAIMVRLSKERDFALTSSLVAGSSAAVMGLYTQCYLAQYLMTYFVIFGLLVGLVVFQMDLSRVTRFTFWWLVLYGAVLGAGFTLYPYVQTLPVAFVLALLLSRISTVSRRLIISLLLALTTLAWSNRSLQTLLTVGGNSQYAEALNGIARYHVFPFYDSLDVFARALGLKDWALNSRYLGEIMPLFGFELSARLRTILSGLSGLLTWLALAVFAVGIVSAARSILKRGPEAMFSVTFLLLGFLSFSFFQTEQVYFFGKILFSLGALISCFLPLLFSGAKWLWMPLSVFLLLSNCFVNWIDMAPIYLGSRAPAVFNMRTHANVFDSELLSVGSVVASHEKLAKRTISTPAVVVIGRWDYLAGTDKDRIVIWFFREVFANHALFFTELVHPGGGLWNGYKSGIGFADAERMIQSGDISYVLVCPGYDLPPQAELYLNLVSDNSWGKLYIPRRGEHEMS